LYVSTRIEYYHIILVRVFLTVAAKHFLSEKKSANAKDERYLLNNFKHNT
jgi:hypothetical protein